MDAATAEKTPQTEDELGVRFHRALDRLWTLLRPADLDAVCCEGLTPRQWALLRALCGAAEGALPMGALAETLGLTPSGVTRCADPLVSRGLVERRTQPGDRRVCCLAPTEAGAALSRRIEAERAARESDLFRQLPIDNACLAVQALEQLAEAAAKRPETRETS